MKEYLPAAISLITSANLFVIRTINRTRVTQPGTEKLLQYILTDYFIHNGYNLKKFNGSIFISFNDHIITLQLWSTN